MAKSPAHYSPSRPLPLSLAGCLLRSGSSARPDVGRRDSGDERPVHQLRAVRMLE